MPAPASPTDGDETDECCKHCHQMRTLFRELDEVLTGLHARIQNVEARR